MAIAPANKKTKNASSPNGAYDSLRPVWDRNKAICGGEQKAKAFDKSVNVGRNLLIPFSPSMQLSQFNFYKAEAELPGIISQFSRMLVGGLLRKKPTIDFAENVTDDIRDWIFNSFARNGNGLVAFLDEALYEELQTDHTWVFVDYPRIQNPQELSPEDAKNYKPYASIYRAENIINWQVSQNAFGDTVLQRIIVRGQYESFSSNEFHPDLVERIWVHELNDEGNYQIRIFDKEAPADNTYNNGRVEQKTHEEIVVLKETIQDIKFNGEPLRRIPAWPLNGKIQPAEPALTSLVDKEVNLYNKVSRRNHLLYGAATYTPVISSDMTDDQFDEIVNAGLGSWIKLDRDGKADVLKTPTEALSDMDRAIESGIEEMAKLGIRMLTPETAQSGVALEIRNAAQTAQLGSLNTKVSATMSKVIAFMINWRYDLDLQPADVEFTLSSDFNPLPLGADWLRLATEWYREGLVPRSVWLQLLKQNDMIDAEYDDEEGVKEINSDELIPDEDETNYADSFDN
jgi:hypothetical protein